MGQDSRRTRKEQRRKNYFGKTANKKAWGRGPRSIRRAILRSLEQAKRRASR